MQRGWMLLGLVLLSACAGQPTRSASTHALPPLTGPTSLDYVVYASMADASRPLAIAGYRTGETEVPDGEVKLN